MILSRVVPGVATASLLIGSAIVTLAQGVFNPTAEAVERTVGGVTLVVAAYLIVRWTFRLLQEAREQAAEDRDAALKREELLLAQLATTAEQLAEVNAQLVRERELRLSLEKRGLTDRRDNGFD